MVLINVRTFKGRHHGLYNFIKPKTGHILTAVVMSDLKVRRQVNAQAVDQNNYA
jgi:hypothetical protein